MAALFETSWFDFYRALFLLFLFIVAVKIWNRYRKPDNPYREGDSRYQSHLSIHHKFTTETLAGFRVLYRLDLLCRRVNNEDFNQAKMLEERSQSALAMSFDTNALRRHLAVHSCFFHFEFRPELANVGKVNKAFRIPVCGLIKKEDGLYLGEVRDIRLISELNEHRFKHGGCEVELIEFERDIFCKEIVEENYAMLSEEQKDMILKDDHFGEYEEMLAVAALKRRLDFLEDKSQKYDSENFTIETESVGRGLKIKWNLKDGRSSYYDIVGFRRTGGFFADEFDENQNGTLVVHSDKDGEVTELLKEGEANFYTFFLRPRKEYKERRSPINSLRFQVTIATQEETASIKRVIERFEERSFNPTRQNVSRALKELGLYVEFDNAIEQKERLLAREIEGGRYDEEEKREKLSRLREVVAAVRDKYQQ